ncbi:MAG TPA: glutathione S-transferase family protein, partial [Rhizomicrobium sp.]|nr:glutathione S-transferase family protein [Rhizomicrobium sp.]
PGANSLKPLLTLAEKNIPYVDRFINFSAFEQHDPEFVKINPRGQVPVLILDDGRTITESTVICEYLDAIYPDQVPLRPKDEYWRAQMRIWTKFIDEYFCWCVSTLGWEQLGKLLVRDMPEDEFEDYVARVPVFEQKVKWRNARKGFGETVLEEERRKVRYSVEKLERDLSQRKWLAGDDYSLADICTYAIAMSVPRMMPETMNDTATPNAMRWLHAVEDRPATKKVMATAPKRGTLPTREANLAAKALKSTLEKS